MKGERVGLGLQVTCGLPEEAAHDRATLIFLSKAHGSAGAWLSETTCPQARHSVTEYLGCFQCSFFLSLMMSPGSPSRKTVDFICQLFVPKVEEVCVPCCSVHRLALP